MLFSLIEKRHGMVTSCQSGSGQGWLLEHIMVCKLLRYFKSKTRLVEWYQTIFLTLIDFILESWWISTWFLLSHVSRLLLVSCSTTRLKAAACCIITYYTHRKEDPLSINYLQKLGLLYKNTFPSQLFLKQVFKNCSRNKLLSTTYFPFISFFLKIFKNKSYFKKYLKI